MHSTSATTALNTPPTARLRLALPARRRQAPAP